MSAHTPGPWRWRRSCGDWELSAMTPGRGWRAVMDFARKGMQGAQPRFATPLEGLNDASIMRTAEDIRELYDNPNARVLAAAPTLYTALSNLVAHYESIMREEPRDEDDEEWLPELNEARKALAMADGQEVSR
jgi:hypothetical protein